MVYVKDGVVLDPPEYVAEDNPHDETVEIGDGVMQGDESLDDNA